MTIPARAAEARRPSRPSAAPAGAPVAEQYCETCRTPLTDGVTGVLDRRGWDSRAGHALAAARQQRRPVALILVDLDRFKAVNDTHGHLAGDAVLRAVAGELSRIGGALVGRYGGHAGDEFLVLLPGRTVRSAARAARAAQRAVARLSVTARTSRSSTVVISGQTVSMGIAGCVPEGPDQGTLADLLLDSDVALRAAKRGGGDLVRVAGAVGSLPAEPPSSQVPAQAGRGGVARPRTGGEGRAAEAGGEARRGGETPGGELRIPLPVPGSVPGGGPRELVLSPDAAEQLYAVLTELLGRSCASAPAS
ncbi:GGDEF domain-containing protein [Streptomyces sp. JJ36]|uniref:GGDEF domain-containing protein n=1 Tax=Streptomyces sp. JJ36 TaxID=2736645 RepID=UPI001F2EBDBC|nr:GGDEF domain-containing protein [Streptomyces sp. JJ36]MCF6525223.1 GGDEF domain-containing protein [Streptomyces sp. JJ36]